MSASNSGGDDILEHVFENIRRFRDQHISTMLHSIIGLPSMLNPPAAQTWVIYDDDLPSPPQPRDRAYSEGDSRVQGKTIQEIQHLNTNWIAQRTVGENGGESSQTSSNGGSARIGGGGGGGEEEGRSINTSSPSTSSSAGAGAASPSGVYVFRFLLPPSPLHDVFLSDHPAALDIFHPYPHYHSHHRHQFHPAMNFADPLVLRSFILNDFYSPYQQHHHHPFYSIFLPFMGFPQHTFLFSPFWGGPLSQLQPLPPRPPRQRYNHDYYFGQDKDQQQQQQEERQREREEWDEEDEQFVNNYNPFRLFDEGLRRVWDDLRTEEERRWRSFVNGGRDQYIRNQEGRIEELPEPQQEVGREDETELDAYDHLDSLNKNDTATSTPTSLISSKTEDQTTEPKRRVIATSTVTKSHTLPDGSTYTKTVRIRRFDDGTEERTEDEHSTPPRSNGRLEWRYWDRRDVTDNSFADDDDGSGEVKDLWSVLMGRNGKSEREREDDERNSRKGGGVLDKLKRHKEGEVEGEGEGTKAMENQQAGDKNRDGEKKSGWFWSS